MYSLHHQMDYVRPKQVSSVYNFDVIECVAEWMWILRNIKSYSGMNKKYMNFLILRIVIHSLPTTTVLITTK